jgi:hypothetical protein
MEEHHHGTALHTDECALCLVEDSKRVEEVGGGREGGVKDALKNPPSPSSLLSPYSTTKKTIRR